jgi:hypothetical protein
MRASRALSCDRDRTRKRGLVPLAIADEISISLRGVVDYLEEAGVEIRAYLTTWNEPSRELKLCVHCRASLGSQKAYGSMVAGCQFSTRGSTGERGLASWRRAELGN